MKKTMLLWPLRSLFLAFLACCSTISFTQDRYDLSDDKKIEEILTQSILIESPSGSGSGFLYLRNNRIYLITAKHVLVSNKNVAPYKLTLTYYPDDVICGGAQTLTLFLAQALKSEKVKFGKSHDFIVIEIADFNTNAMNFYEFITKPDTGFVAPKYFPPRAFTNLESISIGQPILIFGYPSSLEKTKQYDFGRPLLRRGIVSSKTCAPKQDEYTILVDVRADRGMSGGFAMLHTSDNKYSLVGIVIQYVPLIKKSGDENSNLSILLSFDTIVSVVENSFSKK